MTNSFKTLALASSMACTIACESLADGVDKIYDYREAYIGELEILGDVFFPGEGEYALFKISSMDMQLYIPPDAAYVMIDQSNPIIANQVPFAGAWVSTAAPGEERWAACPGGPIFDHDGTPRRVYGDLEYAYTYLDDNYDLYFQLRISVCDGPLEDWAWNDPTKELPSEDVAMDICGNEPDQFLRALGCSNVISNPSASIENVSWAHWGRAYVLCGDVPVEDTISDFVVSMRLDPTVKWQEYWQRVSGYDGPMDGQLNYQLYGAMSRWANQGCR